MSSSPEKPSESIVPQTPELQQAALDIMVAHQTARHFAKDALMYAIWCGKRLREVQTSLKKEGVFVAWLDQNLASQGVSRVTAYRYLGLYDRLTREQQRSLPELSAALSTQAALPVPSVSLTGVYREYGMVKPTVHKPSTRTLTPIQALGGLSTFRDRVQKTDFSRLSASDRQKYRAALAELTELFETAVQGGGTTAAAA